MKRYRLKKHIKLLICLLLSYTLFIVCVHTYYNKDDKTKKEGIAHQIKPGEKGSIEVLAIGNSDLYSGFHPLQLWHEKGIPSYAAGMSMQNMCVTYYMLEEIFKYQKPKVLMLELDNFFETRGEDNEKEARQAAIQNCFPLFKYTDFWDKIKDEPYIQNLKGTNRFLLRGYYYKTEIKGNKDGFGYMKPSHQKQADVKYTKKYFPKIMQLAKENDCQVIFFCCPSRTSWSYPKHNTVKKYADKYHVPFLDMNMNDYGTGFDWMTDTRDEGNHLNHNGAIKVTRFLGQYLHDHYKLKDYRGNQNFDDWEEDCQRFNALL